ncbi:MAG: ArsR/SmtB family transcription factor [Mycoplasmatales bacterium]
MYKELVTFLKLIADENRLKIIDMLSCKELANKELLEYLEISQPTLSHHIKILEQGNLVNKRIDKNTHYYSLNIEQFKKGNLELKKTYINKRTCSCFKGGKCCKN